ncbi:MAG: transglycosylase SLT domain-containing protein [Lautropia sp.]|nr:transglycosylase SLT domain-containing protein [Lautropia sp.]
MSAGCLAACASVSSPDKSTGAPVHQGMAQMSSDDAGFADSAAIQELDQDNLGIDIQSSSHDDLWQRIRAGFAFPELDTPLVAEKERFYLQRPDYLQRMFTRGARYLHHIVEEVEKRGLPTELALLPFVESAMNPTAMSSAKASGLWQFIPSTGRQYDLSQNWWVDNRRDVVQSTRAALDYLQVVYRMHGNDWFLALASYNWGEGSVKRAIRNNKTLGRPTDYLHLRMPTETRHYVPKLIAIKHIIQHADRLGVALPELPNQPYFATIEKSRPIDLALAAQFAGMSEAEFLALNPAHNRPVISASRNNVLKIPADRVDSFRANMAAHAAANKPFVSWHPHTLQTDESIEAVARRSGLSAAELLRANGIQPGTRVLPGTRLLVRNARIRDDALIAAFNGPRIYKQVNAAPLVHRVRRGETASSIARRYGLSVAELRAMNGRINPLKAGTSLTVRRGRLQTVMIGEDGTRRVISQQTRAASASAAGASSTSSAGKAIRRVGYSSTKSSSRSTSRKGKTVAAVRGATSSSTAKAAGSRTSGSQPARAAGAPRNRTAVKSASNDGTTPRLGPLPRTNVKSSGSSPSTRNRTSRKTAVATGRAGSRSATTTTRSKTSADGKRSTQRSAAAQTGKRS